MRRKTDRFGMFLRLLMIASLLYPMIAHAQAALGGGGGILSQLANLLSSNIDRNNDESLAMLRGVLGDFVLDPFNSSSTASSGTLLGGMFKNYNMFIFVVAVFWGSYTGLSALAQTMHEGVVLGQRMSTVWLPIRVTFGAASLMPVFGGWAFCQALMVMASMLGIAGANYMAKTAITSTSNFQVVVNPMGSVKQAGQLQEVEGRMLNAAACTRAANILANEAASLRGVASTFGSGQPAITTTSDSILMSFPGSSGPTGCGSIKLQFNPRTNTSVSSMFGFRIQSVDYVAIRAVAMASHVQTLNTVWSQASQIVMGSAPTDVNGKDTNPALTQAAIQLVQSGYFGSYTNTFQAQLTTMTNAANAAAGTGSGSSAISDQLVQQMQQGGWATLGIWYSVFAEVNESMNEMLDPVVSFEDPNESKNSVFEDILNGMGAVVDKAMSIAAHPINAVTPSPNAVGNSSIGQYILGSVINGTAGANATGASNTINPILAFKNIGDNALAITQALYVAKKLYDNAPGTPGSGVTGKITSTVAGAGTWVVSKIPGVGTIVDTIKSIAQDMSGVLPMVLIVLFATACTMSIYIPMIPFIQWFAALLQWFTSVIESLIGSSLWALAHFDAEGEGMGQRASYGYLYMLNNFARPIIQTFAFFVASGAITVMGTFLFKYYMTAVASAQGSSLTGLISIAGYLVIFAIMGVALVNNSFNMMLHLADRMIGWIGQNAAAAIGHDVENRVNGIFINAARMGSQMMRPAVNSTAGNLVGEVEGATSR